MKAIAVFLAGSCALCMFGCTRVYHRYSAIHPAGTTLPVEVTVTHKRDQVVSGTVYYRALGQGPYDAVPMQVRAQQLWAVLPTEDYGAQDTLQYYIDVTKEGRLIPFGSPGSPYRVTFLDRTELILAGLADGPVASDTHHPVAIYLYARNQPIDQPTAVYQMPGVPGDIRAPMELDAYGNYSIVIPPAAVSAGTWRYAIEIPVDGQVHRRPRRGYRSFTVVLHTYREAETVEATP